jgi:hypothetical protein
MFLRCATEDMTDDTSQTLYRGFRISLVSVQGGVVARIRRADGAQFQVGRNTLSATATTPFPTAREALDQAHVIINRLASH